MKNFPRSFPLSCLAAIPLMAFTGCASEQPASTTTTTEETTAAPQPVESSSTTQTTVQKN